MKKTNVAKQQQKLERIEICMSSAATTCY